MDDEFALCWNNFTDNITNGFQNIYEKGDLIDVTLACDGKLLHAHKIVLAICSPYFQEMFLSNPDKHPIIILKDVSYGVMCELLQFMYQGVVNVKQTELTCFMKIAQLLQIKGLTGNSQNSSSQSPPFSSVNIEKNNQIYLPKRQLISQNNCTNISSENHNIFNFFNKKTASKNKNISSSANVTPQESQQASLKFNVSENSSSSISSLGGSVGKSKNLKRFSDFSNQILSTKDCKQKSNFSEFSDSDIHNVNSNDSDGEIHPVGVLLPNSTQDASTVEDPKKSCIAIKDEKPLNYINSENNLLNPHFRYPFESTGVKRELNDQGLPSDGSTNESPIIMRPQLPNINFSYNSYPSIPTNKMFDYHNELRLENEISKNGTNHMDIPSASNSLIMLSSTSLLHGNCIFNRNNTVATQQGMKTYWLCKSYRISMCRARCITHKGTVISANGVHNHPPHMKSNEKVSLNHFSLTSNQHQSIGNSNLITPENSLLSTSAVSLSEIPSDNNTILMKNLNGRSLSSSSQPLNREENINYDSLKTSNVQQNTVAILDNKISNVNTCSHVQFNPSQEDDLQQPFYTHSLSNKTHSIFPQQSNLVHFSSVQESHIQQTSDLNTEETNYLSLPNTESELAQLPFSENQCCNQQSSQNVIYQLGHISQSNSQTCSVVPEINSSSFECDKERQKNDLSNEELHIKQEKNKLSKRSCFESTEVRTHKFPRNILENDKSSGHLPEENKLNISQFLNNINNIKKDKETEQQNI